MRRNANRGHVFMMLLVYVFVEPASVKSAMAPVECQIV